jgi:hypothetical protein
MKLSRILEFGLFGLALTGLKSQRSTKATTCVGSPLCTLPKPTECRRQRMGLASIHNRRTVLCPGGYRLDRCPIRRGHVDDFEAATQAGESLMSKGIAPPLSNGIEPLAKKFTSVAGISGTVTRRTHERLSTPWSRHIEVLTAKNAATAFPDFDCQKTFRSRSVHCCSGHRL